MKKYRFIIGALSVAMLSSMLVGCGKEKIPETASINMVEEDIYAKEGEVTEKKVEETVPEVSVDSRALLKDALKGITAVRMNTTINVDALPTSTLTTESMDDVDLVATQEETEEVSESTTDEEKEDVVEKTEDIDEKETTEDKVADEKTSDNKEQNEEQTIDETEQKYDKTHSALDVSKTDKTSKTNSNTKDKSDVVAETDIEETEEVEQPVFVPTDESTYYVNMKVTTDMDTTKAKTYGRLRMNLGAIIDKEEASYVDYSVEPAVGYIIKHSIDNGADEEGNSTEEVTSKWYKTDSEFYGIATIKEILEKSDIVSYNESVDSHIIGITVDKTLAEKLDVTHDIMGVLFEGKDTVSMTCYISKADGILTRIVITMTDFEGTVLNKVEVQTNNYVITLEKYNSINKVMIPDTILDGALEITGDENFISDKDLVKYNFEKLAVEKEMESIVTDENSDDTENIEDTKTTKETKDDEKVEDENSADAALKSTQANKK